MLGPTGACAPVIGASCSPIRYAIFGGVRWFRFRDDLEYASSRTDAIYGNTADDFYYRNKVTNDLVGFQIGGTATYCTGRRLSLYSGLRFGVYGNHMTNESFAGSGTTPANVLSTNAYNDMPYSFKSSNNGVATLGELNSGLGLRICRGWTANVGYRLIGVTGVATAPGQIPYDFSLLNDARTIRHDDSLILHGVTIGAMYNW